MARKSVFENMGTGFSSFEIFLGAEIPLRSAELVRFKIIIIIITIIIIIIIIIIIMTLF